MPRRNEASASTSREDVRVLARQAQEWVASEEGQRAIKGALDQAAQTVSMEANKEIKPESLHTPVTL